MYNYSNKTEQGGVNLAELFRSSNLYDKAYWEYYNRHKDKLEKYKNTVIEFDVSNNTYFIKYKPRDLESLIDDLKSLRLTKDMAILNINKYGYIEEQDYILECLGFSKKSKIKVTKDIEKQAQYFSFLFQMNVDKDCFVRFRNNSTGETRAYNIKHLTDKYRLQAILKSKYFTNTNNMMYSLNCFNNMYKANEESLFSLQNIAIDLDFDTNKYTKKEVLAKLDAEVGLTIPLPNLIEHSNRIRLIYSIEDVSVTKKSLNLYKKIGQNIVDRVKDLGIEGSISLQPSTTYARFLGTKNTKNNSKVQIKVLNLKKYKLREMQSILLPKPEWAITIEKANKKDCKVTQEEVFNEFKNKNKSKVRYIHNLYSLNMGRLEDLRRIQTIRQDGYKEILTYLYRNYCYLAGYSEEETFKMLIEFNNNFDNPRPLNKLDGDTKHLSRKQYIHKNTTILNLLDISLKEQERLNLVVTIQYAEKKRRKLEKQKETYRENKKAQGEKLREEEVKEKMGKIKDLREKGLSVKTIAKQLEMGESTVKRYISKLKKECLL